MTAVPLRRNRDFVLLQTGQLLSGIGTHSGLIAYPLLVLSLTGSGCWRVSSAAACCSARSRPRWSAGSSRSAATGWR